MELTPKEKAISLYNQIRNERPVLEANYKSKKTALLLVNEIIGIGLPLSLSLNPTSKHQEYWLQVLKHLNELK